MKKTFLIANISWNPTLWRNAYINPKAGHEFAKTHPGHESLNFKFNKKGIDNKNHIYGFVQWTNKPTKFSKGGIIIFYSYNTDENYGQIVGVYSDVEILKKRKIVKWKGFKNNLLSFNLKANKSLSMLFPIPLDANNYKGERKRITGQIGYSYYNIALAEKIIKDELIELSKSGIQKNEFEKLISIYNYISGKEFDMEFIRLNYIEQEELVNIYKNHNLEKIKNDLSNLKENEPETIIVSRKTYKRDNKTIAQLKILRNFKCQICGTKIPKKDGGFYIEAAHIDPKNKKGRETPDNILILCPNHHKEFDYGARKIIDRNKDFIEFELNDKIYEINLKV